MRRQALAPENKYFGADFSTPPIQLQSLSLNGADGFQVTASENKLNRKHRKTKVASIPQSRFTGSRLNQQPESPGTEHGKRRPTVRRKTQPGLAQNSRDTEALEKNRTTISRQNRSEH